MHQKETNRNELGTNSQRTALKEVVEGEVETRKEGR
jgi:hypothetical protein